MIPRIHRQPPHGLPMMANFSTNDGFRALALGAVSLPQFIDSGAE